MLAMGVSLLVEKPTYLREQIAFHVARSAQLRGTATVVGLYRAPVSVHTPPTRNARVAVQMLRWLLAAAVVGLRTMAARIPFRTAKFCIAFASRPSRRSSTKRLRLARHLRTGISMARTVGEIVNRELLSVRPDLPAREIAALLRSFSVTAVPVVDAARKPLGVVSIRDLFDSAEGTASSRMSRPAICVADSTTIESAARHLARTDMHHLVVVDGSGSAVGMLSSLDLLRGLLGMPARHPATFPHWDEETQVCWTDEWMLSENECAQAPSAAGVLVLISGESGQRDTIVWAEDCANVRERLSDLFSRPTEQEPALANCLGRSTLRARAAAVSDEASRHRIVRVLRDRIKHTPPPGAT
jgi:CBS domain-containing protein